MAMRVPQAIGHTGLQYSNNLLLDREIQKNLRFPKCIETYDKMESDALIAGSLLMVQQFLRKARIYIEPKGGLEATETAIQRKEQIEAALFKNMNRPFDQVMTDILDFVKYGFCFLEPTYKIKDGMITWKDMSARHPSTIKGFKFDRDGAVTHVIQYPPINTYGTNLAGLSEVEIPYNRLLHFRTSSERNNPIGRSLLKNAYRSWYFKMNLEEKEAIGIDREMNGVPLVKMPVQYFNATYEDNPELAAVRDEMFLQAANTRANSQSFVSVPSDTEDGREMFSFQLITSGGTRSIDTDKVIKRHTTDMVQSMLTDFLLMGTTSTGSFALSDNKVTTFMQSLESYLEGICSELNRKAIPDLFKRNGWSMDDLCEIKYKPISSISAGELGSFLNNTKNFLTADATLENAIRSEVGLPPRDENTLYISKPTTAHQAESQRLAMEASLARSTPNSDSSETLDENDFEDENENDSETENDSNTEETNKSVLTKIMKLLKRLG